MSDHSAIEWTDATWNPVTGCTQLSPGCDHCLAPDTPVLYADMVWRPIGEARVGDALVGFDENAPPGGFRKIRPAVVEAVVWSRQPVRRLITMHAEVITTANHRWLRSKSAKWPTTDRLLVGRPLRQLGVTPLLPESEDYRAGYLAGMTLGDGTMRYQPGQRSDKLGWPQAYWRVALKDEEPLGRLVAYLATFGVATAVRPFGYGLKKVEVRSLGNLAIISRLVHEERLTVDWRRGFLAGFFDAEGDHGRNLRVSQKDAQVLWRVAALARSLGFNFSLEQYSESTPTLRLVGPLRERIRFFATIRAALLRKLAALWGHRVTARDDPVLRVERGPAADVVDIQTSTATFFAAGLATHNCYALTFAERFRGVPAHPYEQGFDLRLWPDRLGLPLRWRRPRRIFVNSMSDLFHERIPDDYIAKVFDVMARADWHTFQVLTKRPRRMAQMAPTLPWPANVWAGTSVELDRYAWRANACLRRIPAAIRFVSAEPLLGPLPSLQLDHLHWVIAGGESGPHHRPCAPDWVRDLRDRCVAEGVAFFLKQWGGRTPKARGRSLDERTWDELPQALPSLASVHAADSPPEEKYVLEPV